MKWAKRSEKSLQNNLTTNEKQNKMGNYQFGKGYKQFLRLWDFSESQLEKTWNAIITLPRRGHPKTVIQGQINSSFRRKKRNQNNF